MLEVANGEYGNYTELLAKAATENQWRTTVTSAKRKDCCRHTFIFYEQLCFQSRARFARKAMSTLNRWRATRAA